MYMGMQLCIFLSQCVYFSYMWWISKGYNQHPQKAKSIGNTKKWISS